MQHQIVITLNPEEYREIQRLAKMAGTTSIGQFLHTRLLTFLGMRNNRRFDTAYDTESTVDLTQLGDTITRMHKELKQLLETGEITGYVTGTAPPEDLRDDFISFKFETILQNDYNATPSQPVFLSAETVFNELGVTLPKASESRSESISLFSLDSLPPSSLTEEEVKQELELPVEAELKVEAEPEVRPQPEQKSEPEAESKTERKVDFRIKPQTPEEAIQAAKSIDDELERLAEQAFAQAPLSGVAPVPDTPIEPLAANDPLVDILDEGLVKILEEKTASKITSDFTKPNSTEAHSKKEIEAKKELQEDLNKNQNQSQSEDESEPEEDTTQSKDGFGPPPKKRKK